MEFRLLGPLQVVAAERPVAMGGARHERILAALLLAAERPVSLTRLAEIAYDDPMDVSRRTVQNRVSALRALLAKADDVGAGAELIVRQGDGYLLRTARERVDTFVFEDLVARARTLTAADDRVGAARLLRRALALWRGPALDGLDCEPLHREVAGLDDARLAAWEDCLDLELATAVDAGPFVAELRTLVARHPLRQRLTGLLMTALHRDGRQADALAAYRDLATRLADEHGLDPAPDLQDLHRAILRGDVPRPPAEPGPPFGQPAPAQLPAAVRGFTGRAAHLDALDAIAAAATRQPTTVVVTAVSGTAGVGKTALAIHWAHRVRHRFPDGQLYVNLRGFDPTNIVMAPTEVVLRFLHALEVPPHRIPADPDARAALYRTLVADRKMLVVLDNARDVDQVRPLLSGAAGCLVLVTSRDQLTSLVAAEGAHFLPLDLLTPDEARDLLTQRLGAHRVDAEPDAVDEIINHCARLPLALAIVAARAATHPALQLAALAGQLRVGGHRLDALTTGHPTTDIQAVFAWSYRILTPAAARLFRLLGLHPGPDISIAAAASLAGTPPPLTGPLLAELAQANLIVEHTPGRYAFHDLLRAYAAQAAHETDTDDERRAAARRLLDHYLHTAYAAASLLHPARDPILLAPPETGVTVAEPTGDQQALAWFTTERAVLLAAVDYAASTGFDTLTWQLAWATAVFLDRRGYTHDWVTVGLAALAAAQRLTDLALQAHAHRILAAVHIRLGSTHDAHTHLAHALDLCRHTGDQLGQAHNHHNLGLLWERRGCPAEAVDHARQALDLYRATGNRSGQADALTGLGWYHVLLGNHRQALTYCQQALILHRDLDDRLGRATAWDSLGYAHHHLGHHNQALTCYQHALDLFHHLGDPWYQASTLSHIGDTHHATNNSDAARAAWQQALDIFTDLDSPDAEPVRAKLRSSTHNGTGRAT
ncbi:MAG TPA: BTAD domain-containing putative transcriptional regulator [Micromonosporaceae bacterium]|nr:BTAD domain-containing putative transcriptional regulator [Micromonosporaceae bacterium]